MRYQVKLLTLSLLIDEKISYLSILESNIVNIFIYIVML